MVAADLSESGGSETVALITSAGGEALFVQTDVSKTSEVKSLIEKIVSRFGRLDFAHNNAGTEGAITSTDDCRKRTGIRLIDTNLTGVWLCLKYEISQMLQQRCGAIVDTSSMAGLAGSQVSPRTPPANTA